jgi:hypothetical protein
MTIFSGFWGRPANSPRTAFRLLSVWMLGVAIGGVAVCVSGTRMQAASDDPNAYFNALVARADHFKSNSLRTQAAIDAVSAGKPNTWVTYDSQMDAARTVIPAFREIGLRVGAPMTADADRITFAAPLTSEQRNLMVNNRGLLLDNEIVTVTVPGKVSGAQFPDPSSVLVLRSQYGTGAVQHSAGAPVTISQNNLLNQVRVPLAAEHGHVYFFTWDVLYGTSYLGNDLDPTTVGRKEFQLAYGTGNGHIWLETRISGRGHDGFGNMTPFDRTKYVALVDGRTYFSTIGLPGSNVTNMDSLQPQAARFMVRANVWTRFYWLLDERASDFDRASLWVADENTAPVKIFNGLTLKVPGDPPLLNSWWIEQNTSRDQYRGVRRDLVSYVRNFASLIDPADIASLLVQPGHSTAEPITDAPLMVAPPQNVRIIK